MAEQNRFRFRYWTIWFHANTSGYGSIRGEGKYYAEDMSSKHGVFINSRRISSEAILVDDDQILIGQTTLLFADKDFQDRESALSHFKKIGERMRPTHIE